jgi:predicted PurR-regulated permease PerM
MSENYSFTKRVAITAFITLLLIVIFYLLGKHGYFFLLVFAGILLAVLFSSLTNWFKAKLRLQHGLALFLAIGLFFGSLVGAFFFIAPTVSSQVQEMKQTLPDAADKALAWLGTFGVGQRIVEQVPDNVSEMMPESKDLYSQITSFFTTTLSVFADILIVIVTAIFLAVNPTLYTVGFSKLFPVKHRTRILDVLDQCYETLKLWLIAMILAMTIIGITTAIGYSLIGVPMAFALALIAFLFAFIPNIGPWIAAIPAVLVALTISPQLALYAMGLYGAIQLVESYAITPLLFQKTVDLPPALLLFFQVFLGILQGGIGLLLAAPLLAVLIVIVNELYVKDVLEKNLNTANR